MLCQDVNVDQPAWHFKLAWIALVGVWGGGAAVIHMGSKRLPSKLGMENGGQVLGFFSSASSPPDS